MKGKYKGLILVVVIIALIAASVAAGFGKDRIDIAGSTSVQPLAEQLAEAYAESHPNLQINVQGGGSGLGIRSVSQGIADIGTSSKELSAEESEGVEVVELGKEGIVIGVHNSNTVNDLSTDEIRQIFSGEITNWKELGGPDEEIHVVTREDGSGTRDAFESIVMDDQEIKSDAIVQSSTESIKQTVSTDPGAIGYMSFAHMSDDVKALTVNNVEVSEETIADGSYELQRPFLFVINSDNISPALSDFLDWVKSPEGEKIIVDAKIVP